MQSAHEGRHRLKGGMCVHATRLVPDSLGLRGVQTTACGETGVADLPEPRSAAVTCQACLTALRGGDR